MDTKTFFENFETIANAPGGIARLRELILDLARNGQIGIGESSEIAVEMMRSTPQLSDVEVVSTEQAFKSSTRTVYFTKIKDVIHVISQSVSKIKTTEMRQNGKYPVIDQGQMKIAGYTNHSPAIDASENPIIVFGDHTRNLKYVDFPFVVGADGVKVVRPHFFDTKFFFYMCKATRIPTRGYGRHFRHFQEIEVPIFSIDEQQYIVAKVDKLMALCDQLELAQQHRDSIRTSARKSAIDSISTASTPEELDAAWKRINQNWTTFADTPESISSLRSLILDLAVRGNIVASDAADYQRSIDVDLEKLKLDEEKLWKLNTALPEPARGWSRVPMARLGKWGSGGTPTTSRKEFYRNGTIPWAVIGDLNNSVMTTTESLITKKALESSSAKMVPVGAVLVAMYGASIGKSAISGIECCTNQAIAHCVVDEDVITSSYMFLVVKSLKKHLMEMGKGAAQPNISQTVLKHLVIDIPPLKIQEDVIVQTDELIELCDQLEASLALKVAHEESIAKILGRLEVV